MEVIGKTTNGVIISATDREVAEILRAKGFCRISCQY